MDFNTEGKIYVTFAIVFVLLIGLIFYLYKLDKKLTKIENTLEDEQR